MTDWPEMAYGEENLEQCELYQTAVTYSRCFSIVILKIKSTFHTNPIENRACE